MEDWSSHSTDRLRYLNITEEIKMSDAMVDLETMGTGPNSRILSLGAVMFDYRGIEKEFYHKITKKSCDKLGLEEDESTKQWWAKQSAEAREVLMMAPAN